jgi:proliferating cell nuclear antigen PCNA
MKLTISDKNKKDLFVALFQILKNCTNMICIYFNDDHVFIQGIDKSHVCMFEVKIFTSWFNEYTKNNNDLETICFDTHVFYNIISTKQDGYSINIQFEGTTDSLNINLITNEKNTKSEFNKFFKIPLIEFDYEIMTIPTVDYDADFSINSKQIYDITSQMLAFGDDINIKCSDEQIDLITNGVTGEMLVTVPIDDLTEYSIIEGDDIDLKYSLGYVHKMCLTNKLSSEINFFISREFPMKIKYDLGDNSSVIFYIAPKVSD